MKKNRFSSLRCRQDGGDLVYEVELLEQSSSVQQFLVNTRDGFMGDETCRQSGSKSFDAREEASRYFNQLVIGKLNQGYFLVAGDDPLAAVSGSETGEEQLQQPRSRKRRQKQAVYQRFLELRNNRDEFERCNRLIWRLGELEMKKAAPALLETLEQHLQDKDAKAAIRVYALIWALGRCGDALALPVLQRIADSADVYAHIKRMALQAAWRVLSKHQRQRWLASYYRQLPASLRKIAESPEGNKAEQLLEWASRYKPKKYQKGDQSDVWFVCLYLRAHHDRKLRKALLKLCRIAPMEFASVWLVRLFFKIAEFELDPQLLAILTLRIENCSVQDFNWYGDQFEHMAWQRSTREYFRHRTWRLLRRLGELGDMRYVDLAAALLQQYDGQDSRSTVLRKYSGGNDSDGRIYHLPPFSTHVAMNQVLYRHSKVYRCMPSAKHWCRVSDEDETARAEAFPHLWDRKPQAFLACMKHSRLEGVHHFAVRGLRKQQAFLATVKAKDWKSILLGSFQVSAEFAAVQLEKHHPEALAGLKTLRKMLNAPTAGVRGVAHRHLIGMPAKVLKADMGWCVQMITSEFADNRDQSRLFRAHLLASEKRQQMLLKQLLAYIRRNADARSLSTPVMENINWYFAHPLKKAVRGLDFDVIQRLLRHRAGSVKALAASMLLNRKEAPEDMPRDILLACVESKEHEVVRISMQLLARMDDARLVEFIPSLASLLLSENDVVRRSVRRLVSEVADKSRNFCERILDELIRKALTEDVYRDSNNGGAIATLATDFHSVFADVDSRVIWRLLVSRKLLANQLGAAILHQHPASIFTVRQWARLGKHMLQDVREWARRAYEENVALVKQDLSGALGMVDTGWLDTRRFALEYFRQQIDRGEWKEEHLVYLGDSVRDDVQQLAHDVLSCYFESPAGAMYLLRLAQHTGRNLRLFVIDFLHRYAAGKPEVFSGLEAFFVAVLSGFNTGRFVREKVFGFLCREARKDQRVALFFADLLGNHVATLNTVQCCPEAVQEISSLQRRYPALEFPMYEAISSSLEVV